MRPRKSIRFFHLFALLVITFPVILKAANAELGWGPEIKTGLNIYVALNGNDQNDGSDKTPFKTIAKAQNYIRSLKSSGGIPAGGITVWIHGGRYQMAPLTFTSADNGTTDKPVIYRAVSGEQVSFFTGKMIDPANWKALNAEACKRVHPKVKPENLCEIDIAALAIANANPFKDSFKDSWSLFDFVVNNQRQAVSQWPNPTENIQNQNDPGWTTCNGSKDIQSFFFGKGGKPTDGITTDELDLDGTNRSARWKKSLDAGHDLWLKGFWRVPWSPYTVKVSEINPAEQWIQLAVNSNNGMGSKYSPNADAAGTYRVGDGKEKWCAVNYLDEIDTPGEWAYDFKDKKLYYYPAVDLKKAEAYFADNSAPVIKCNGTSYLRFIALNIEGSQGNGVDLLNSNNILVAGCTIRNVGTIGINDKNGMNNSYLSNNSYDTGSMGFVLTTCGNTKKLISSAIKIQNNHIHHVGRLTSCFAVKIDQCVGVEVSHNLIHDIPAGGFTTMVAINWTYEYNEIHNIALKEADNGAFYNYGGWICYGNEVKYNFIHHINRSNGLYTDDGTSGYNYFNNIIQNSMNPFLNGGGHHNIYRNNLIVDGIKPSSIDDRGISRKYFVSNNYGEKVRSVKPDQEPWLSYGKSLMKKYDYPATDLLWSCTLDSMWHPEYPNGSKFVDNVEVNSKGFRKSKNGTTTLEGNITIPTVAEAAFFDYPNMDLRSNNTQILSKLPTLNTEFPKIGLLKDDYRVRLVSRSEVGGLSNRGSGGDPWSEDPVHP